ncbi:MAG: hypothetical protein AVDCRST_MAG41-1489 [uncultured Corynebacteriales bacterium]|uniref:Uncharacterized protein n=1 Tax=uncultured Mycobacteriales bacterium TaxID=581187 RepID=A0A6J4I1Q0_9ACTN|nr:MAG: hypothetical protein AVDCRST_MAG41-1489 [uncultured Corynebacteriales bacterium]
MTDPTLSRTDHSATAEKSNIQLTWKDFSTAVHGTAVGTNGLLAAVSTGLAVWADGLGRWVLCGLAAVLLVLFVGQVVVGSIRARQRERARLAEERHRTELTALREESAAAQQEAVEAREEAARTAERAAGHAAEATAERARTQALHSRHGAALTALHDMWLGYPAPYTDDVELTYLVGADTGGDRVVEHRRTTPEPGSSLPFLQGRLTTPTQLDADAVSLADVEMVTRSEDDRTAIRQIALSEAPGLLRCMFVFRPAITEPVSWYARYRMPGMWDVLRDTGHDRLTWTPSPRVEDPERSTLIRLVVNFDFPPDAGEDVFVRDQDNHELKRLTGPDGSLRYRWETEAPRPERYGWDLWWARPLEGRRAR